MYGNKIDIFIFGLKDDDTNAILSIIFADYSVVKILIFSVLFGIFCFWLSAKIMRLELRPYQASFSFAYLLKCCASLSLCCGFTGTFYLQRPKGF